MALLAVFAAALAIPGCSSGDAPARHPEPSPNAPNVCAEDQVREFFCEGLIPMSTALGAPDPYGTCPAGIESPPGQYPAKERVARFDAGRTEWARSRAKPGHSCCYSWCATVEIANASDVLPYAGCGDPGVFRESYCMPELEAGTSTPAPSPLDRCPIAIRPPEVAHFSVPKSAPLDLAATQQRRSEGQRECCYGWCSRAPAGVL